MFIENYNKTVDYLNDLCDTQATKTFWDGICFGAGTSWLQKVDYIPIVSTIGAVARLVFATLALIGECLRGEPITGIKKFCDNLGRALIVTLPIVNFAVIFFDDFNGTGKEIDEFMQNGTTYRFI